MIGCCVAAIFAGVVLWTAGLLTALHPLWLCLLLLVAALPGTLSLIAGLPAGGPCGRFVRVAAGASLGAALLFPAALLSGPGVPAAVTHRGDAPESSVKRLRLVDFNVLHGYPRLQRQEARFAHLAAALAALDPTVVVLQEAWSITGHGQLAARLGARLGLDVAYAPANGSRRLIGFEEGSAVLSRLPILEVRRVRLAPRRPFWECRIALFVTLDLGGGERLTVVGVHLTHAPPEVAVAQARDVASRLPASGFIIVAGDLNAASDSAVTRAFSARSLDDVVPGGIDHVLAGGLGDSWTVERADWTLRAADMVQLIGEEVELSDHPGIFVDLVRRSSEESGRRSTAR